MKIETLADVPQKYIEKIVIKERTCRKTDIRAIISLYVLEKDTPFLKETAQNGTVAYEWTVKEIDLFRRSIKFFYQKYGITAK